MCPEVPFHFAGKAVSHERLRKVSEKSTIENDYGERTMRSEIILGPRLVEHAIDLVANLEKRKFTLSQ